MKSLSNLTFSDELKRLNERVLYNYNNSTFDFSLTRFFNESETDYSTIFIDHNKRNTFDFKFKNPRTRTYNINEYLNTFSPKNVVFKLTVDITIFKCNFKADLIINARLNYKIKYKKKNKTFSKQNNRRKRFFG